MGEKKKKNDGENNNSNNVVLKIDMHCEGCASKIIKYLRGFPGVETVKAESETGKITITGKVEPTKVKEKLAEKMKKKVELVSPQPKKEKENKANNNNNNNKTDDSKKTKEKEPPVTTAVLKVALHCQGCLDRIGKTVMKTKGVHELSIDKEKETVTVKGTMDVKGLAGNLMEKLKRKVEVVPPKKDKDNDNGGGGDKEGSGKKKNKGGGDGNEDGAGGKIMEQQNIMMMDHFAVAPPLHFGFGYGVVPHGYNNGGFVVGGGNGNGNVVGGYGYTYVPVYPHHAPQIFSDENPNACSIM